MEKGNYSALDDDALTHAILGGEIPLFSLQIDLRGDVKEARNTEDYGQPYNITGGPKSDTVRTMHQKGLEAITQALNAGRAPKAIVVNHDAFGGISVKYLR